MRGGRVFLRRKTGGKMTAEVGGGGGGGRRRRRRKIQKKCYLVASLGEYFTTVFQYKNFEVDADDLVLLL